MTIETKKTLSNSRVKSKNKTRKYKKLTKYLKMICNNSGECLAIGNRQNEKIKKIFENYENFNIAYQFAKRVGKKSMNGFVYEISYSKNGYQSNTLLKSSVNKTSDNLYYEYLVGVNFINIINNVFPCFTETYHILRNKSDKLKKKMMKNTVIEMTEIESEYEFLPTNDKLNLRESCTNSDKLAILVQYLKNPITIDDYLDNKYDESFTNKELSQLLYQIYGPLSALGSNFTHYDLHSGNVLLYELKNKTYITMKYVYQNESVIFNTRYVAKIIDYGRTYFYANEDNNSESILKRVCNESLCNDKETGEICGEGAGYQWLIPPSEEDREGGHFMDNQFICSSIPNVSHDLLLAKSLRYKVDGPVRDILRKIVYTESHGTEEITVPSKNPSYINNVYDMELNLRNYIIHDTEFKGENQQLYDDDEQIGILTTYMDVAKEMVFESKQKLKKRLS
jgi:hypothetical protein